jgi:hypothetical protein
MMIVEMVDVAPPTFGGLVLEADPEFIMLD